MLQEITPMKFKNQYDAKKVPTAEDYVFAYADHKMLMCEDQSIPKVQEIQANWDVATSQYTYLFSINQMSFYLLSMKVPEIKGYHYESTRTLLSLEPQWLSFAGATATHLGQWYADNQFCGRCGHSLVPSTKERSLLCPNCGNELFPRISPAILVGVIDGDKILLTKFLTGYSKYTVISGYNEIGETLEDTVRREISEEVGLSVHNIRYYSNQPWGLSGSLLVGFFADLDQEKTIHLEKDELSKAKWFRRSEIPDDGGNRSLSRQMMEYFRDGKVQ